MKVEQAGVEVFDMNCVYVLDRGKGDLGHQGIVAERIFFLKKRILNNLNYFVRDCFYVNGLAINLSKIFWVKMGKSLCQCCDIGAEGAD